MLQSMDWNVPVGFWIVEFLHDPSKAAQHDATRRLLAANGYEPLRLAGRKVKFGEGNEAFVHRRLAADMPRRRVQCAHC